MADPVRAALTALRKQQAADKLRLGPHYLDKHDLVFGTTRAGRWPASGSTSNSRR